MSDGETLEDCGVYDGDIVEIGWMAPKTNREIHGGKSYEVTHLISNYTDE